MSWSPVLIMIFSLIPVMILVPMQVILTLKAGKFIWKAVPSLLTIMCTAALLVFLKENGIYQLLILLYGILLLLLCGAGSVITRSIQKSGRK